MKTVDKGYDSLLKANYDLVALQLSELKELAKSWYENIDFSNFDNRKENKRYEEEYVVMKRAGLMSNFFFAYLEDGKYYLLDGFNRLFTDYGKLELDMPVYLKIITDKLEEHQLMAIMFQLNLWKLSQKGMSSRFTIHDFLDRGFRLFIYSKFNIEFYHYEDYYTRKRNECDINVLDHYFISEHDFAGYFKCDFDELFILMNNPEVLNDFREILKANDYLEQPFGNYRYFLYGYAMYISELRVKGDKTPYKFETFLEKLYADKKFFKKLVNMSGNDSTRKNIYHFFRGSLS